MERGGKAALIIILTVIVLAAAIFFVNLLGGSEETESVDLYFMNAEMTSIVPEKRELGYNDKDELVELVISELSKGPLESGNNKIMSKDTKWTKERSGSRLLVDFSQEFLTTDNAQNLLSTYAVVKSLCSVQGVSAVKVTVAGGEIITPAGTVIDYISDKDINLEKDRSSADTKSVKLYFADENGLLLPEWRTIKLSDTTSIGQNIVTELIKGPENDTLLSVISADTGVISVEITENTAYVNMHQSFIDKNSRTPEEERLAVYSIVNSLCETESVSSVQFLIEGKKISGFKGIDLSGILTKDETLLR